MNKIRSIREATSDDATALKQCMESAYSTYQDRMKGIRLPPMDVDYLAEIERFPVWVIEDSGQILGGLIMDFADGKALIANIAVNPNSQGQGIGGA
jgi:N-acetylglutamate synthase-like GNAT family acetyltransferase